MRREVLDEPDRLPDEDRLSRAVIAAPRDGLSNLAWAAVLLHTDRASEALPLAETARAMLPTDRLAIAVHAHALAAAGRCAEAVNLQSLLISLVERE